ncbi:MAG TPA: Ig-like domain-containing protein, partial [Gemmatimonadales bacterium]|nr:Ig-like domain-containing protein [Gemmatimonadales bacterium]
MISRARLAVLAALTASLGCATDKGGVANVLVVATVDVAPGIWSVVVGNTTTLAATAKTASGLVVPGRAVTWSSLNATIASVSSGGVVTGNTVGGPVTIRATVDGVPGDALITVNAVPVSSVTVSPPTNPLVAGGSVQLTATARDAAGAPLSGRFFTWQSSDPTVAAVTTEGMVLALSAGGP